MMPDHIDEDLLIYYADESHLVAEIEEHLRACSQCRNTLAFYRTLNAELREEETWAGAEEVLSARGQDAIREFADRIAAEDAEARLLLDRVIDSPYRFARANIARKKRFRTGGVVRRLCEAVREECDREPLYAMELAQAAQALAEALPDDYYPSAIVYELRGRAWKEYATACQFLARYESGLDALLRAERAYSHLPDGGAGLAAVSLSRAILLWKLRRYAEALPFARAAAMEYATRRDSARYIEAQEVEAVILQRAGDHAGARAIYQRAFDAADDLDDLEMKARTARNLGINYRDSGDLGHASQYLLIALQLYEALGFNTWIARTRWSIARLLLSAGNFKEAETRLRPVIHELEEKGLSNDAADAKLDLAEALLMFGRFDEVESICTDVAAFYRETGLVTGALTAATFLKEAAARRLLQREHIDRVRAYLAAVRENPDLQFASPPLPR